MVVAAFVAPYLLRRLAAGLDAQPRGPQGAGRRGGGRPVPRASNHAARV